MSSRVSGRKPDSGFLAFLRTAAVTAMLAGAGGSLGLMLYAGRHQNSRILLLLFAVWVLSPFVAAVMADAVSKRLPILARATMNVVMLVLTLGSLAIYWLVAFGHIKAKIGFIFLVVPLTSLLLIAVAVLIAWWISVRPSTSR